MKGNFKTYFGMKILPRKARINYARMNSIPTFLLK